MNATTSDNERPQIFYDPMIFAQLGADPVPVASLILGKPGRGTSGGGQR